MDYFCLCSLYCDCPLSTFYPDSILPIFLPRYKFGRHWQCNIRDSSLSCNKLRMTTWCLSINEIYNIPLDIPLDIPLLSIWIFPCHPFAIYLVILVPVVSLLADCYPFGYPICYPFGYAFALPLLSLWISLCYLSGYFFAILLNIPLLSISISLCYPFAISWIFLCYPFG